MHWLKKKTHNLYLLLNIFSIVWYLLVLTFLNIQPIENKILQTLLMFSAPILLTIFGHLKKKKCSNQSLKSDNHKFNILYNLLNLLAICLNFYIIIYFISINLFPQYSYLLAQATSLTLILIVLLYTVHFMIKYLFKISYAKMILFLSLICLLGWFNLNETSLIPIFTVVLNTVISIDDRQAFFRFLDKHNIINKQHWNLCDESLSKEERHGQFIAQKIIIYIFAALFYLVIRITENTHLSLYILSILEHKTIYDYSVLVEYLYRGGDRIILLIMIFILLSSEKDIKHFLTKSLGIKSPWTKNKP